MSLLQNSNAIESGGYLIERSLRFQSASSQYLSRTFGTPTNAIKWTVSFWVKRGTLSAIMDIFGSYVNTSTYGALDFLSGNTLSIYATNSVAWLVTTPVFRDPSAWYHIVVRYDSANATASNRVNIYVNGTECAYSTDNRASYQNQASGWNRASTLNGIGAGLGSINGYLDGYIAEFYHIDGQALTPSSFGETDALTGVWVGKKYTGTYGNNGFYLPFNDGTSTTTLGQDRSGNANNWTLTNFTRSAGVSDCWMYDVPSGNSSGSGTQPSSNYAVMSPIFTNQYSTLNGANLDLLTSTTLTGGTNATIGVNSGKWYWEVTVGATGNPNVAMVGIRNQNANVTSAGAGYPGGDTNGYAYYGNNGQKYTNNAGAIYGSSFTNGDVIGVEFDADAGTIKFYKNNVSQGIAFSGIPMTNLTWFPALGDGSASVQCLMSANFGQRSFAYTPPSGFRALCTANLPAPTIAKGNQYMDATLFTGTAATLNVTNAAGFSPDLVWIKQRNAVNNHYWFDSVRGVFNYLFSDGTNAEASASNTLTSFNSNGFTLGTSNGSNPSGGSLVAWQWDAGSSTVTNTSGSISSQVRANTTAGFSIVTYTGTGANATVGHGLGVAPKMVIVKTRSGVADWAVYHDGLGNTKGIYLNQTSAAITSANFWNNTSPTSTVFTTGAGVVGNGVTAVAYCFAEIAGFSKFGSYTGNGSADGPFVFTGFRPKFVMVKRTDTTGGWSILDTARNPFNVSTTTLRANVSDAEVTGLGGANTMALDFTSNGFKFRDLGAGYNASGGSYIYACFAENPFSVSNAY